MTYRERREARADRLRGWAEKREQAAGAVLAAHEIYRGDTAFNTQPGRIPLRSRVIAQDERAVESLQKARSMAGRAVGIESQLAGAIYSDDPDAIEQLRARLAKLEAERDRVKAYNATCRKGARDISILDENQQREILGCARIGSVFLGKGGAFPGYHLTNLSGNIARNRARLEQLERQQRAAADKLQREEMGAAAREAFLNGGMLTVHADQDPKPEPGGPTVRYHPGAARDCPNCAAGFAHSLKATGVGEGLLGY
jgi:hypothetical protein